MNFLQKQTAVLNYLRDFIPKNAGAAPTYGEILRGIGLSSRSNVHAVLRSLQARGFIRVIKGRKRGIELVNPADTSVKLSPEISSAIDQYASQHGIQKATAANELLRQSLGLEVA